jgi:hypothetical protein
MIGFAAQRLTELEVKTMAVGSHAGSRAGT